MTRIREIYLLDPACLPPETIAVAFAKTSRSPESFKQIAAELSDENSANFHQKWVVGYGHSSVAEHAVLHIALENISRLAVETVESCRLASYTEKSSRYQVWDSDQFFIPPELDGLSEREQYLETLTAQFALYACAIPEVEKIISKKAQLGEKESETSWQRRVRSESADVCRYLLPAAALANVGLTINARSLEHTLKKMLSHPLDEVRQIGAEMKAIAQQKVPTLVKYANPITAPDQSLKAIRQIDHELGGTRKDREWCNCFYHTQDGVERILAASLMSQHCLSYEEAYRYITDLSIIEKEHLFDEYLSPFGEHDIPPRELEHVIFSVDVILDQGAYFELKRHRMMTQTPQALTVELGFAIPRLIEEAGLLSEYKDVMQKSINCYYAIEKINPQVAAYIVPNAFNRRVLLTLNFRTALHLIALRSAANAHFAMRRFACRLANEIRTCSPVLGKYLAPESQQDWKTLEKDYFLSCQ